ncbi:hypothetical protein K502DRAFT_366658 [Neoconidiobolus thromboides FSU 785]|nr:hypothetical protein K502DRAFT_366658 [Neoconidiobolus thromboides FSU 785]
MEPPKYYITLKQDASDSAEKEISDYIYKSYGKVIKDSNSINDQVSEQGLPAQRMFLASIPNDIYNTVESNPNVDTISPLVFILIFF